MSRFVCSKMLKNAPISRETLEMRCLLIIIITVIFIIIFNTRQSMDSNIGPISSSIVSVDSAWSSLSPENSTVIQIDTVVIQDPSGYKECSVELWNNVTTDKIDREDEHRVFRTRGTGNMHNLEEAQLRVLSAFVYQKEIVVTTTAENSFGKTVYCRYFDCNRIEIPNSTFQTFMFPITAAYCARRAGAKFMGLTESPDEVLLDMYIVPLVYRVFDKPVHEVAVCVGPIYGNESRWMEIVETTEHHILMGIHYFYHTIFNEMDSYTRKLMDEYQRLGLAEVTVAQTEYRVMDWMFHNIQMNECFYRARHHSKWILNVDIDERLVMLRTPLLSYLQTIPEDVGEISFAANKIQRNEALPEKYSGLEELRKQLLFLNNNVTSETMFMGMKELIRPDKTDALFYHWTWVRFPGSRVISASKFTGYIRHYRTTLPGLIRTWTRHDLRFRSTKLDRNFEEKLWSSVTRRLKSVYEQREIWCDEIPNYIFKHFTKDNYHCIWKANGTLYADDPNLIR